MIEEEKRVTIQLDFSEAGHQRLLDLAKKANHKSIADCIVAALIKYEESLNEKNT